MEFEKLYTAEDVAQITGLTLRTIRNYIKSGKLKGRRIGVQWRFTAADIQALFEAPGESPARPEEAQREAGSHGGTGDGDFTVPQQKTSGDMPQAGGGTEEKDGPAPEVGESAGGTFAEGPEAEPPIPLYAAEAAVTAEEAEPEPETLRQVQAFLGRRKASRSSACAVVDMPGVTEQEARFLYNRLQSLAAVYQDGPKRLELSYEYDENRDQARYVFSGAMESVCAMLNLCEVQ